MIGIGIGIPRRRPVFGGATQSLREQVIAALYGGGAQGYLVVASSELYQDDAGTTVAANSNPVGQFPDQSGNENHFLQSSAAAKPTYETDGTLHWITGDGSADFLETGVIDWAAETQITLFFAASRETTATMTNAALMATASNLTSISGIQVLANGGSQDNWNPFYRSGGDVESYRSTQTTAPTTDVFVMTLDITNSGTVADQLRIWTNGVEDGSVSSAAANAGSLSSSVSRLLRTATAYGSSNIHAAGTVAGLISDENRTLLQQFLAQESGVTL